MIRIDGARICLRTFTREEYYAFYKSYVADPIMDPEEYVYDAEHVDAQYDRITSKEGYYPRMGIFLHGGPVIGELSLKRIDCEKSRCEIGVVLANDGLKGQRYGSEAIKIAIGYVFGTLGLQRIYADTMGSNVRMQAILDRFGFRLIGIDERYYDMRDRWEDRYNYVLENEGSLGAVTPE